MVAGQRWILTMWWEYEIDLLQSIPTRILTVHCLVLLLYMCFTVVIQWLNSELMTYLFLVPETWWEYLQLTVRKDTHCSYLFRLEVDGWWSLICTRTVPVEGVEGLAEVKDDMGLGLALTVVIANTRLRTRMQISCCGKGMNALIWFARGVGEVAHTVWHEERTTSHKIIHFMLTVDSCTVLETVPQALNWCLMWKNNLWMFYYSIVVGSHLSGHRNLYRESLDCCHIQCTFDEYETVRFDRLMGAFGTSKFHTFFQHYYFLSYDNPLDLLQNRTDHSVLKTKKLLKQECPTFCVVSLPLIPSQIFYRLQKQNFEGSFVWHDTDLVTPSISPRDAL